MEYDNTNRGAVWPNKDRKSDKHPTHTGSINVDGVEYWVSAWAKGADAKPNAPSLKLSIKRREEKPAADESEQMPFDDDIPF